MDLLKSIDVFREVCQQMSFSQAAERLNLVPSAVSRQINELEKYLGVRLLERTTRSISLTDEGGRYLKKMDAISQEVQALVSLSRERGRIEGHIRLTAPPVLGPPFLNAAFDKFLHEHPNVSVSMAFVNREINLIEEGFDLAVRIGDLEDSTLVSRPIGEFPLALVASPSYLEAHGVPAHPKDLAAHNCLINTLIQSPRRWRFRDGRRAFRVKIEGRYEVNDDLMLQSLARAGHGIAYLPACFVRRYLKSGELVSLLASYLPAPLPISIIYPSRRFLGEAKRLLIEHLIMQAEKQPLWMHNE